MSGPIRGWWEVDGGDGRSRGLPFDLRPDLPPVHSEGLGDTLLDQLEGMTLIELGEGHRACGDPRFHGKGGLAPALGDTKVPETLS